MFRFLMCLFVSFCLLTFSALRSGQEIPALISTFPGPVNAILFLSDDDRILVGVQDEVHLLGRDGKILRSCTLPIRQVTSIEVLSDGQTVYVAGGDPGLEGKIFAINLKSMEVEKEFDLHHDVVSSLAISPDGKRIVAASIEQNVGVLDLATEKSFQLSGHSKAVTGVDWIDDQLAVSVAEDMSVRVWDVNDQSLVRTMNQHVGPVLGVRLLDGAESPRPVIATWGKDRTVRFWQPTIGRMMRFAVLEGIPLTVCWNSGKRELIVGDSTGSVRWIDWQTGKVLRAEKLSDDWIVALDIEKKSGQILAGTSSGELLRIVDSDPKTP